MRYFIFLLIISISSLLKAQSIQKPLLQANIINYKQQYYVYGLNKQNQNLFFKCYQYNSQLVLLDSVEVELDHKNVEDYLDITTDTLHDVINFYFQLANHQQVDLLRINKLMKILCYEKKYDANHINTFTLFDTEKFYQKNNLFLIRTNTDTGGTQFYLNKYELKNKLKPFDYLQKWQYAFERNHIHRVTVIFSDSLIAYVYAHVNDGLKKGQWVLKFDILKGQLQHATRLGSKLSNKHYLYSNCVYDYKTKNLFVIGSTYEYEAIDFKKQTSNFINLSKRHQLFLIGIDSTGESFVKAEKIIGLPIQTNFGLFTNSYHLKIRSFKLNSDNTFNVWTDMYAQIKPNTFAYNTSWHFDIIPNAIDYDIIPSKMIVATKVLPKLINLNDADIYGKFFLKNSDEYDLFKYKPIANAILVHSSLDKEKNPFFVLKKTDILQGTKQFYKVSVGKKGPEQKQLLRSLKHQLVNVYVLNNEKYISFISTIDNTGFELKINTL